MVQWWREPSLRLIDSLVWCLRFSNWMLLCWRDSLGEAFVNEAAFWLSFQLYWIELFWRDSCFVTDRVAFGETFVAFLVATATCFYSTTAAVLVSALLSATYYFSCCAFTATLLSILLSTFTVYSFVTSCLIFFNISISAYASRLTLSFSALNS